MAKTYYAATRIKFGKRTEDGSQDGKYEQKILEVGDKVEGFSKEEMMGFWDAGALTTEAPQKDEDEDDEEVASESAPNRATKSTPTKAAASSQTKPPSGS